MPPHAPALSVVVPVFDEAAGIERAVADLEAWIAGLGMSWELVLVDDGSRDGSAAILRDLAARRTDLRVLSLERHEGRGRALREGLLQSRGRIALTTEADSSWDANGLTLLARRALSGEADVLVASPHLPGAGLEGVPLGRRLLSRAASLATRLALGPGHTMSTGMTRAYRADVLPQILSDLPGKEFHVDVLCRALALGLRVREVPVRLVWHAERRARRSSGPPWEWLRSSCRHLGILARHRLAVTGAPPRAGAS